MTARISLALVIHNHQPVGNFGWVIEDVFHKALRTVDRCPRTPPATSGWVCTTAGPCSSGWTTSGPTRIRPAARAGRSRPGGDPRRRPLRADPRWRCPSATGWASSTRMRDDIERRFGRAPLGAWLAERVWEPALASDLAEAGYALHSPRRQPPAGRFGGRGRHVGHLHDRRPGPAADHLRHREGPALPDPVPAGRGGDRVPARRGDRGRPTGSGSWATTARSSAPGRALSSIAGARSRWIDDCFEALAENADWLTLVTPSEWLEREAPIGRIYVPTSVVRRDDRVGAAGQRGGHLPRTDA